MKKYIVLVLSVIVATVIFGFLCPMLISSKTDVEVMAGFGLVVVVVVILAWEIEKLIAAWLQSKEKEAGASNKSTKGK